MSVLGGVLRCAAVVWASPYTIFGLLVGVAGLLSGGRVQRREGVIEFYEGGVKWFLHRLPGGRFAIAITFGHVVLGQTAAALDISRQHERVHVRQYERWGPLMGPAYLGCSLVAWLRGRDPYRDNPFEVQAFDEAP